MGVVWKGGGCASQACYFWGFFFLLFNVFTLCKSMVIVGLCSGMLRLYCSWMILCRCGANVCFMGGVSRRCMHINVASDGLGWL